MLIAIDTSTAYTGVACYDEAQLLGECAWLSGRDHTTQLLPQLDLLLHHIGRERTQISAIGVALGPGSWSGLRVGVSAAKGLALAHGLPLIGIGTLDSLAYQHRQSDVPVVPLIRLGRERFATATFEAQTPWTRVGDVRNTTLSELAAPRDGAALFCGDLDAETMTTLRQAHGERALFPTPAQNVRRPGFLAELAWQRFQQNDIDNLATLEPIYLGPPVTVRHS